MAPGELQIELKRIVDAAGTIHVQPFEEGSATEAVRELVPTVVALIDRAASVLGSVLEHYESKGGHVEEVTATATASGVREASGRFYEGIDAVLVGEEGVVRITDLAFMARWELARKQEELESSRSSTELWSVISECGSARRKLTKSLTAVEVALASHEGRPSELEAHYVTERARAQETRRVYARFRSELSKLPPTSEATAETNLRAVGTAIAVIVGYDIYEDLRVSDRMELRKMQRRILEWLRGEVDASWEVARRVFEDVETCANLFMQVNHRAELRSQDEEVVRTTLLELPSAGSTDELAETTLRRVRTLFGRDEGLDELIEKGVKHPGAWRPELVRVLASLSGDADPAEPETLGAVHSGHPVTFAEPSRR